MHIQTERERDRKQKQGKFWQQWSWARVGESDTQCIYYGELESSTLSTGTSWVPNFQIEALQRLELPWRHRFLQKRDTKMAVFMEVYHGLKLDFPVCYVPTPEILRFSQQVSHGFPVGRWQAGPSMAMLSFAHWPGLAQWRALLPAWRRHPSAVEPETWTPFEPWECNHWCI